MASETDPLVRTLGEDLSRLGDRFGDEEFSTELYRALTNRAWFREGGPPGHVALSWSRAEEVVNEQREARGEAPLTLAQTGGEGEVAPLVEAELGRLGWRSVPLETGRHDEAHVAKEQESPPPPDHGQRRAPSPQTREWERRAHRDAASGGND